MSSDIAGGAGMSEQWVWHNYAAGSITLVKKGEQRSFTLSCQDEGEEDATGVDGEWRELATYLNELEATIAALRAELEQALTRIDSREEK